MIQQNGNTRRVFFKTIDERAPVISSPVARAVRWSLEDARELQRKLPRNPRARQLVAAFEALMEGRPVRAAWLFRGTTILHPPLADRGADAGDADVS
jgi:hypothetical protein